MLRWYHIGWILCLVTSLVYAEPRPTVNVLTWWGILDDADIRHHVEGICDVQLSYDVYFSDVEFLRRIRVQHDLYDVVIFSDILSHVIQDVVMLPDSDLWQLTEQYHPLIRERYFKQNYPSSMVYLLHGFLGFVWNSELINLASTKSFEDILDKTRDQTIMLVDDVWQLNQLLGVTQDDFSYTFSNAEILITNDIVAPMLKHPFAYAITWSGEALMIMKQSNKNHHFLLHPELLLIVSDILAQLNSRQTTACVARELAGPTVAEYLQRSQFYFTPYVDYVAQDNSKFIELYQFFVENLEDLTWSQIPSSEEHMQFENLRHFVTAHPLS